MEKLNENVCHAIFYVEDVMGHVHLNARRVGISKYLR